MSGTASREGGGPFAAFRVAVDHTDAELDAIMHALWARQQRLARPPWGWWTIVLGAAAALAGSFLAQGLGAIRPRDATVLLILLAAYWIGFWAEGARVAWGYRRTQRILREDQRDALRGGTTLLVSMRGVAVRRRNVRAFYAWQAIMDVQTRDGLILLLTEPGHALAIPERLLTPAQRTQVLARADPPCPWA